MKVLSEASTVEPLHSGHSNRDANGDAAEDQA